MLTLLLTVVSVVVCAVFGLISTTVIVAWKVPSVAVLVPRVIELLHVSWCSVSILYSSSIVVGRCLAV